MGVKLVRTRDGDEVTVEYALENAHKLGYPKNYIQAVVDNAHREPDGKVHVTDLVGCLKRNVLRKLNDYTVDLEQASNTMVGTALHDYFTAGDVEHKLHIKYKGIPITGSIDLVEKHDGKLWIWDFKGAKSFKVMKALGIQKIDEPVLDEDGNQVFYKSGQKSGQPKTKKVPYRDSSLIDAVDYEQQLNAYKYMLENQIKKVNDPVYKDNEKVSDLNIFFLIKDFGKDSKMNGIESNTTPAPMKVWDVEDTENFLDRAKIVYDALYGSMETPACPTDPNDNWGGRMCDGFCEFRNICNCVGGTE